MVQREGLGMMTVDQAFALGLQHHQAGRLADAEALYRQILGVQPQHAQALHFLGVIAHQTGNMPSAVQLISQSLKVRPDNASAHSNLGETYRAMRRWDEAAASFRRALEIQPAYAVCRYNLGNVLKDQSQLDAAIEEYRRALELDPKIWEAWNNLGNAQKDQGLLVEAIASYRRAHEANPGMADVYSNLIFTSLFAPGMDAASVAAEQKRWTHLYADPVRIQIRPHTNHPDPERRLRIGYVSADFRDHAVGWNVLPLLENHDRAAFEIFCYSGVGTSDGVTEVMKKRTENWRDTARVPDDALAELIRRDAIDVLVDLGQHTHGNRLPVFARCPAPVQVSFAGYPESTGLEAIRYRISDPCLEFGIRNSKFGMEIAGTQRLNSEFPEERVFLIPSFWCYVPSPSPVALNSLPAATNGGITFGSLNNFCKINEPVLELWARVLRRVPDSRLVFLSGFGRHRERTRDFLERAGIAPQRVEFEAPRGRQAYLELYRRLDIVLDPFPYNGHMTSLDALWMGVPVVSLAEATRVSRGGLSILSNLGLPDLVARSGDEYVAIAVRLAGDCSRLAQLRATLRPRLELSILMDEKRFTRNIEAAYRAMWRQWCGEKSGAS